MKRNKINSNHIRIKAVDLLKKNQTGLHTFELIKKISKDFPHTPFNTIRWAIWDLAKQKSDEIYKVKRGVFRHKKHIKK